MKTSMKQPRQPMQPQPPRPWWARATPEQHGRPVPLRYAVKQLERIRAMDGRR